MLASFGMLKAATAAVLLSIGGGPQGRIAPEHLVTYPVKPMAKADRMSPFENVFVGNDAPHPERLAVSQLYLRNIGIVHELGNDCAHDTIFSWANAVRADLRWRGHEKALAWYQVIRNYSSLDCVVDLVGWRLAGVHQEGVTLKSDVMLRI